jgi:hypothetical protein
MWSESCCVRPHHFIYMFKSPHSAMAIYVARPPSRLSPLNRFVAVDFAIRVNRMWRYTTLWLIAAWAGAAALSGCNNSSSERQSVKSSVVSLRDALALGSGGGACDLMTSRAREQIVHDASKEDPAYAKSTCADVLDDVLASVPGGLKTRVRSFGHIEAKTVSIRDDHATARTNTGATLVLRKVGYRWLIDAPPSPVVSPAARRCRKGSTSPSRHAKNLKGRHLKCA